jgi:hypothetical protein
MARKQSTFIGNIKSRWAKVYALHDMGFDTFLDPSREWTNDSPEVIALKKLGEKHSNAIGISPGKLAPMQYLSCLLSQLGLNLKSRKEGKTKRIYSIDILALNDPARNHVLRCIEERLSQNRPKLNWEAAINEDEGIPPKNQDLSQSQQAIQPPAPAPQNVYISDGLGVSTEISAQNQNESALSEKAQLCLEALADLETPNHPTICTSEQLLELFVEVEAVGQECEEELPSGFWSRASVALGVVSESLESNTINAPTVGGLAGLVERLAYAFNFKAFCRVISGWATEVIEDAIALQDGQPLRSKMTRWLLSVSTA